MKTIIRRKRFTSIGALVEYLRSEGWKPVASTPRMWKRVHQQQLQTATVAPAGSSWTVVEENSNG